MERAVKEQGGDLGAAPMHSPPSPCPIASGPAMFYSPVTGAEQLPAVGGGLIRGFWRIEGVE